MAVQDSLPTQFGRYFLLHQLAQGGMGTVYLARRLNEQQQQGLCVIKKLRTDLLSDRKYVNRFIDEAKLVLRLNHPSICHVFDVGLVNNEYFLAMEYFPGVNLRAVHSRLMQFEKALPDTMAVTIISDILSALDYAHHLHDPVNNRNLGLVHRDVSPQNVLVDFTGSAKLIDFGLADSEAKVEQTETDIVMGKVSYMSPEQARGEDTTPASDQFSLAMILYELLTGQRYYDTKTNYEIWQVVGRGDYRPKAWNQLPEVIARILGRALEPNPTVRFATCAEFAAVLNRLVQPKLPQGGIRGTVGNVLSHLMKDERENQELLVRQLAMIPTPSTFASASSALPSHDDRMVNQTGPGLPDTSGTGHMPSPTIQAPQNNQNATESTFVPHSDSSDSSARPYQNFLHGAKDVSFHFTKVLSTLRLYSKDHDQTMKWTSVLYEKMRKLFLSEEVITFEIKPFALAVAGTDVYASKEAEESIAHPFFLEGIQKLIFETELSINDLHSFMVLWADALLHQRDYEHSFTTKVWEQNFAHIHFIEMDDYNEVWQDNAEDTEQGVSLSSVQDNLLKQPQAESFDLPQSSVPKRRTHFSQAYHTILEAGLTEQLVEKLSTSAVVPVFTITQGDKKALHGDSIRSQQLNSSTFASDMDRFLFALAIGRRQLPSANQEEILSIFRIFFRYTAEHNIDVLSLLFQRALSIAQTQPLFIAFMKSMATILEEDEILDNLVRALDDKVRGRQALSVLGFVSKEKINLIIERIPLLESVQGKEKLAIRIATTFHSPEKFIPWLQSQDNSQVQVCLEVIRHLPEHTRSEVFDATFSLGDAICIRRIAPLLGKEDINRHRKQLHIFLTQGDKATKRIITNSLMRIKDKSLAPVLINLIRSNKLDIDDKKTSLRALGMLGSPEAIRFLREVFAEEKLPEVKAIAALSLARARDLESLPILEEVSKKRLFVNRTLKDACTDAIKILKSATGEHQMPEFEEMS